MTDNQKQAILDVCKNLISTGIAFVYQKDRLEPAYPAERGLAKIVEIVEGKK
jgi:hypothetical protein